MSVDALVTGASGLIGGAIAAELTTRGHGVGVVVRRAASRMDRVHTWIRRLGGDPSRVVAIDGDLDRPGLGFVDIEPLHGVRLVFHAGGRFEWGLGRRQAFRTNRDGLLELVALARHMPHLRRFVMIGGFRAPQPWLSRHDGAYVGSKLAALRAFRRASLAAGLPTTVIHPGDVIGDSRTGLTSQLSGLGHLAQLVHRDRLLAHVGSPRAWVPMEPLDHLARFTVCAATCTEAQGQEYFAFDDATPSLHQLVIIMARTYGRRAPRLTVPLWLARRLPSAITGVHPEALAFVSEQRYDTRPARALASRLGLRRPPIRGAIDSWLDYLARANFFGPAEPGSQYQGRFACDLVARPKGGHRGLTAAWRATPRPRWPSGGRGPAVPRAKDWRD